ncbi:MAG TPA: hypothetical protein PLN54_08045 [Flavobacteriales bacterium]|nr:hypothetical protein [Flavobacteriales bacterium]
MRFIVMMGPATGKERHKGDQQHEYGTGERGERWRATRERWMCGKMRNVRMLAHRADKMEHGEE